MAWFNSGGIEIYFKVFEPRKKNLVDVQNIIFAHGAGGNSAVWFNQTKYFSRDYRCVVFDHRGFARSSGDINSMNVLNFRDDLIHLMDHLRIRKAHLVGQSMGGYTALRCALDFPERVLSLILSGSSGGIVSDRLIEHRKKTTDKKKADQLWKTGWSQKSQTNLGLIHLFEAISDFNVNLNKDKLLWNLHHLERPVSLAHLSNLKTPTLIINGIEDTIFPSELLETFIPFFTNAEGCFLEDCGHSPFCEKPDEFNQYVWSHIKNFRK